MPVLAFNPDPAWIALVGTIVGTLGLKVAEHFLGKGRVKIDDASNIRNELRLQIAANEKKIDDLEDEVEKWRREYYDLRDKYIQMQTELRLALDKIKDEEERQAFEAMAKRPLDKPPPPVLE